MEGNSILKTYYFLSNLEILTKFKKTCIIISHFGYKNGQKYLIYISKNTFNKHVNLLLIEDDGKSHYALIKNFNRFV